MPPLSSYSEQISVCAGPGKVEIISVYTVNQQPVTLYMALLETCPVSGQPMIFVNGRKGSRNQQGVDHSGQQPHIAATFDATAAISLKGG